MLARSEVPYLHDMVSSSIRTNRTIAFLMVMGIGYLLLSGRLVALAYRILYSDRALLVQQLHGDGCWFHYASDRDRRCEFEWSYFDRAVRNPEYHCPMRAAKCLAMRPHESFDILEDMKRARDAQQREFDTGDGVIKYYECIDAAVHEIEAMHNGNYDTTERSSIRGLWACSS